MRPPLSPTLTIGAPLVLCGLVVAVLIWRETSAAGFWAGLGLALLPVPILLGTFHWIDGLAPRPWRTLAFAFGWGACAATLFALIANGLLVGWLTDDPATLRPTGADRLELTVIAPVVEETAKGAAVFLLFLHRPHAFSGVLPGILAAGLSATGFAFTENILYLGSAFTRDQAEGVGGVDSATAVTFFVRIVLAPFAHPMFTALTGIGFGLTTMLTAHRRRWRALPPLAGLATAMGLHSAWNASASLSLTGFAAVYLLLMVPVFCALCWLTGWSRERQLRVVRDTLPLYAAAGWLSDAEPRALGSLRSRSLSRRLARQDHGPAGWRAVTDYQATATALALLRDRAQRGGACSDFAERERDLLRRLTRRRALAAPPTVAAGRVLTE
ncbi:PrsW family intramembrane metalloprotease [Streptomyces litchfieldiae]|uniref:PrsW family intramembrane metalloprotease n=1 Tax=Streptomyces litchfieldiae TaxID=3075543 RepID=A0ABU2N197_9ACTN|nr:PrsW family intramembrane metalloprotease [Streptomyces sp. DSM 44938]MDT0347655.1 PrsW family intramembrane metalloprotease [Streptomyces sp. DSM 44938]